MAAYTNFDMSVKLNNLIEEVYTDMIDAEGEADKSSPFRSSSFPYCPIIDLENRISGEFGFVEDFSSSFFTMVGTAIHENFQLWAPRIAKHVDKIWGNWVCEKCGKKDEFGDWIPQVRYSLHPEESCKCGHAKPRSEAKITPNGLMFGGWSYLEVGFKPGDTTPSGYVTPIGFSIDVIFLFPQGFVLNDLKSTGLDKLQSPNWRANFPYHNNVCQLSNYMVLFQRAFEPMMKKMKKKLVAWALIYLSREHFKSRMSRKPIMRVVSNLWTEKDHELWGDRLDNAVKGRSYVEKLLDTGETKYAGLVVKYRPCRKKKNYHDWMKAKFEYYTDPKTKKKGDCPHYHNGECTAASKVSKIMQNRVEFLASTLEAQRREELKTAANTGKKKKKLAKNGKKPQDRKVKKKKAKSKG